MTPKFTRLGYAVRYPQSLLRSVIVMLVLIAGPEAPALAASFKSECNAGFGQKKRDYAIVFVHGYGSSPEDAFTHDETSAFWPNLVCTDTAPMERGPRLSDYAVYTYDWSDAFERSDLFEASEIATGEFRDILDEHKNFILVGHSAGGLIIKKVLARMDSSNERSDRNLLGKIKAVLLIATPSEGSKLAESTLAKIRSIFERLKGNHDKIRKDLEKNSDFLRELDFGWRSFLKARLEVAPWIYCFYETDDVALGIKPVERSDIDSECDEERAVYGDHIELAKPASIDEEVPGVHQLLRVRIARALINDAASQDQSILKLNDSLLGPCNDRDRQDELNPNPKVLLGFPNYVRRGSGSGIGTEADVAIEKRLTAAHELLYMALSELENGNPMWQPTSPRNKDTVKFYSCPNRTRQRLENDEEDEELALLSESAVLLESWLDLEFNQTDLNSAGNHSLDLLAVTMRSDVAALRNGPVQIPLTKDEVEGLFGPANTQDDSHRAFLRRENSLFQIYTTLSLAVYFERKASNPSLSDLRSLLLYSRLAMRNYCFVIDAVQTGARRQETAGRVSMASAERSPASDLVAFASRKVPRLSERFLDAWRAVVGHAGAESLRNQFEDDPCAYSRQDSDLPK